MLVSTWYDIRLNRPAITVFLLFRLLLFVEKRKRTIVIFLLVFNNWNEQVANPLILLGYIGVPVWACTDTALCFNRKSSIRNLSYIQAVKTLANWQTNTYKLANWLFKNKYVQFWNFSNQLRQKWGYWFVLYYKISSVIYQFISLERNIFEIRRCVLETYSVLNNAHFIKNKIILFLFVLKFKNLPKFCK